MSCLASVENINWTRIITPSPFFRALIDEVTTDKEVVISYSRAHRLSCLGDEMSRHVKPLIRMAEKQIHLDDAVHEILSSIVAEVIRLSPGST